MEEAIRIALIQPSSPPKKKAFEEGLEILKNEGFSVRSFVDFREDPPFQKAFLLFEIMTSGLFTHLWAARGGSGALKLLPYFEELFKTSKKLFSLPQIIGFSDITTLHLYFYKKFGKKGLHGPMVATLGSTNKEALKKTFSLIKGGMVQYKLKGKAYKKGETTGVLLGGNLMTLASLCGTPYFPEEKEIILFIEETKEPLYRIERAFLQILFSLKKDVIKGLVIGDLGEINPLEFLERVSEFLLEDIPIGFSYPFGHIPKNFPLVVGANARLKVYEKFSELELKAF